MGYMGQGGKVRHVELGVANALHVEGLGVLIDRLPEGFGIVAFHQLDPNAQARQRHLELVVGAAIEIAGGDNVIPRLGQGAEGEKLGRLTTGRGQGRRPPF